MIKVNVVPNDSKKVAKVVIIDDSGSVLMLKRSNYMDKFAGEWDLPGGHIKIGEDFEIGMRREVKEETNLDISGFKFVDKIDNLNFYYSDYNNAPIKISHEHTGFRFFRKEDLDPNKKFDKIALRAMEMKKND